MNKLFGIEFNWLDRQGSEPVERMTFAEITITVAGVAVTELEDIYSRTIRPSMRGSAYALAMWLLTNWWRLVREPERKSLTWEMSHRLGAIGEGFLWPNLTFSSDGSAMLITMFSSPHECRQMVRYLNGICEVISVDEFERTVLDFADAVIERLNVMGCRSSTLHDLRKDLADELCQTELRQWREIEALLGYDTDEAPEKMVTDLLAKRELFGSGAVDEMLAQCSERPLQMLDYLDKELRPLAVPMVVPDLDSIRTETGKIEPAYLPWQSATTAVRVAKNHWKLPDGAVSNKLLTDLFSLPSNAFTPASMPKEKSPITIGFRNGIPERMDAYINTPFETNRRFALLRLVADRLFASNSDRFLPVTSMKTARQKFQRAFAQEFLCPAEALKEFLGNDFGEDNLAYAAHHFNVSTRLVQTTLVNKGYLDRSTLFD
jgi:hypothetical protein